jgi:L-asparaginase / beta-aspartyl-peptidase
MGRSDGSMGYGTAATGPALGDRDSRRRGRHRTRRSWDLTATKAYRAALAKVVAQAGAAVLDRGGSSLDAVEAAIRVLEDDPLFNASRGAVFDADGKTELDAAIMDGATMHAGAVADVTHTRYPITLARAVMEKTPYVLWWARAPMRIQSKRGWSRCRAQLLFYREPLAVAHQAIAKRGPPDSAASRGSRRRREPSKPVAQWQEAANTRRYGTVGVVAVDRAGQRRGRHFDRRLAGQDAGPRGRFADHWRGHLRFESILRRLRHRSRRVLHPLHRRARVCALVQYKGYSLQQAADEVIQKRLAPIHGDGGVIAVAPDGQMAWSFNTPGMFRARLAEGGKIEVHIYNDEP